MIEEINKQKQGKKNRASGADFERRVRKDLEENGWIVSKWMNQVKFVYDGLDIEESCKIEPLKSMASLVPAKHKFAGVGRPMAIGTGFVDFLAMRNISGKEILEILKND